jgi:opacity protein-like surface antigen
MIELTKNPEFINRNKIKQIRFLLRLGTTMFLIILFIISPLSAQKMRREYWNTGYAGIVFPYNHFEGQYHSKNSIVISNTKFSSGMGIGIILGFKHKIFGFEASYNRSKGDLSFTKLNQNIIDGKIHLDLMNWDFQFHPINTRLRPYLLAGLGFYWLTPVNNSDFMYTPLYDGNLDCFGYNLGGGIEYRPARAISIAGTAIYRYFDQSALMVYYFMGKGVDFSINVRFHLDKLFGGMY